MFTIIGSYDQRTNTGTIAAKDAHSMVKGSKLPKPKPPKKTWEDCRALAKALKVLIGYDHIDFPNYEGKFVTSSSFEQGKSYSYSHKKSSECYEALLILQRDRLARLSDEDAIAQAEQAKSFF
jgi:hypothetical protein